MLRRWCLTCELDKATIPLLPNPLGSKPQTHVATFWLGEVEHLPRSIYRGMVMDLKEIVRDHRRRGFNLELSHEDRETPSTKEATRAAAD